MKKGVEIRDPLHGVISVSSFFLKILDHSVVQRLRGIKQLDFMEFSFPGALHSRYLHSLGVFYLAEKAFDQVFHSFNFSQRGVRGRLKTCFRLSALLHDIGHGPLSHASEKAMPSILSLWSGKNELLKSIQKKRGVQPLIGELKKDPLRQATHEDYTVKFLLDSSLSEEIKNTFCDIDPFYISALIDRRMEVKDDFFIDQGFNFRPILSQLISSDLDLDRMDYLGRDAYFCGLNLGRLDWNWLISNMTYYEKEGELFLALYRRAFPSFEQFLFTRHQMRLMVYFHYKSVIYKEILNRYFLSVRNSFTLPSDIEEYTDFVDGTLFEHLFKAAKDLNPWAQRIIKRNPYQLLFESYPRQSRDLFHFERVTKSQLKEEKGGKFLGEKRKIKGVKAVKKSFDKTPIQRMYEVLKEKKFQVIFSQPSFHFNFFSSSFFSNSKEEKGHLKAKKKYPSLFLIDIFNPHLKPQSIASEQSIQFFKEYEQAHYVERLYVDREEMSSIREHLAAEF